MSDETLNKILMKADSDLDSLKDRCHNLYEENQELKSGILEVLNNKRGIMTKQMLYGMSVDYQELLFQVDEEIRKILKESEK